ncbi:MAG: protein kinase domain-containing protein [Planctomycetota bacterium]
MDPQRYARIRKLFEQALAREGAARETFLVEECGELRGDVEALLASAAVRTESLLGSAPTPPERIGRYRVEQVLGEGGMGVVYLARDGDQRVAIKVLHPWLRPVAQERFRREAEAGIALRDEHVVRTLEARPDHLVMEYVEGRTLRELLNQLGRVPESLLREIALQTARGLDAIHSAGLLHRDLKPENILLSNHQQVRIMDLGIAKALEDATVLTAEGQFLGSLAYAAPEQLDGTELGPRTDLYALGVVLYELASGTNPFRADDPAATIRAQLDREAAPLRPLGLSRFFSALVTTLLQKDPERRLSSARELALVLEEGENSPWWQERERRVPTAAIPVARKGSLCGRTEELAMLRSAWTAARKEEGCVVTLSGAEGTGKSRLLAEWLDGIDALESNVLYGAFAPRGGGGVIQALRDHIGRRDPEKFLKRHLTGAQRFGVLGRLSPGQSLAPGGDLAAAFAGLLRGLAAERPLLWIADDVQFADEEAKRVLAAMARATRGVRVLLVLSGAGEPLRIGEDARIHAIELAGLDEAGVAELLTRITGNRALAARIAPRVAEFSDGVPLVVHEMARALHEQGIVGEDAEGHPELRRPLEEFEFPRSLHELVARRVERLDASARRVLDAAAVAGIEFDPEILAEVLDRPLLQVLQEMAEIERGHGLVRSEGRGYRFEHHLVAGALADALPETLRRELHALVGEAWERRGAPLQAVRHHLEGNRPARAGPHLDAALGAVALSHEAHAALAARALEIDGLLEGERRIDVLLELANDLDVMVRRDGQKDACEKALALARECKDGPRTARAWLALSGAHFGMHDPDGSLNALDQALSIARQLEDRSIEISVHNSRGTSLGRLGRRLEARAELARAKELAQEAGDARLEAVARLNDGLQAKDLGAREEAEREVVEAIRLARESGDRRVLAYAHANLGLLWAESGRFEEALEQLEEQRSLAREIGDPRAETIALSNRGLVALHQGRLGDALADYGDHLELARLLGERRGVVIAHLNMGEIERVLGRIERAREHFREAEKRMGEQYPDLRGRLHALESELARQEENWADAEREAEAAIRIGERIQDGVTTWYGKLALGLARQERGEHADARRLLAEAEAIAVEFSLPTMLLPSRIARALSEGDADTARRALEEYGPRCDVMQLVLWEWKLFQATGDGRHRDAAREYLNVLRREAPPDATAADFENVRLYRDIDHAP